MLNIYILGLQYHVSHQDPTTGGFFPQKKIHIMNELAETPEQVGEFYFLRNSLTLEMLHSWLKSLFSVPNCIFYLLVQHQQNIHKSMAPKKAMESH